MNHFERTFRLGLAAILIAAGGDVFLRYYDRPEPPREAQEFLISLTASGYIWPAIGGVFLVSGALLFFKKCVGIALILLFPVTANIALYTLFLDRSWPSLFGGGTLCALHLLVVILNRDYFRSLIGK